MRTKSKDLPEGKTRVIVVRHGETEHNTQRRFMGQSDSPLTDLGYRQIEAVARRLSGHHVAAIYCSDLGRAAATATKIADRCSLSLTHDTRLRERALGVIEGMVSTEARAEYPEIFAALDIGDEEFAIPGGESVSQVRERTLEILKGLAKEHPGKTVVAVSHGFTIRTLLGYALGLDYSTFRKLPCDNTSLNVFTISDDRLALESWNDSGHLSNLQSA